MSRKLKAADVETLDEPVGGEDEGESDLPEPGSYERIGLARKIAHAFLDEAATPADRKERLEKLREELPRRDRRQLRIPSPVKAIMPKPVRTKTLPHRECPRCHERVLDLGAHKDVCPKKAKVRRWELAGPPAKSPITWDEASIPGKGVIEAAVEAGLDLEGLADEIEFSQRQMPSGPVEAALDGFELVEWCLTLADMLWPGETSHDFLIGPKRESHDGWWSAAVKRFEASGSSMRGIGPGRNAALSALADALRAEVGRRQQQVADIAKFLEER